MFNKASYIETIKLAFPNWSVDKVNIEVEKESERWSKVKTGDKVLHIIHSGPLLSEDDFEIIEKALSTIDYELSRIDTSGRMMASTYDFLTGISIYLNQETVQGVLLSGVATNALWDVIKLTITNVYNKVRNKTIPIITSSTAKEKTVTINVVVNYDERSKVQFAIENIGPNDLDNAIESIKQFKKEPSWEESNIPQVAIYIPERNSWKIEPYNSKMLKDRSRVIRELPIDDYIKEVESREKSNPNQRKS